MPSHLHRMVGRTVATLTLLARAVALAPTTAHAQVSCTTSPTCNVDHTVNLTVPATLRLTIGRAATTIAATAAEVIAGASSVVTGPTIQVVSNRLFSLTVATTTPLWTGPVGTTKPASDLLFAFNGGPAAGLRTTATTLVTGGPRGVQNYTSTFQATLNPATDFDGAYTIVARFTASAP